MTNRTEPETVDYDETTNGPPQALKNAPAPAETPEGPDDAQEDAQDTQDDAPEDSPGREAAKYRRKLRAAERERDELAETVTNLQRAEVERLAAEHLSNPAGLWVAGSELGDLLDDAGRPDPSKVRDAATAAVDALGLARPKPGQYVPAEGSISTHSNGASMIDVVMGR